VITRRSLLTSAGVTVLGLTAGALDATAATESSQWEGNVSANGWTIDPTEIAAVKVAGSTATVVLRAGAAGAVLLHVIRRWHYEIGPVDTLEGGGLAGHTTDRTVAADFESNHLSGTAVALHPAAYPLRGQDSLWPHHELFVRDILVDCAGTVVWGGDLTPAKRSHFHIAAQSGSRALSQVAERLRTDIHTAQRPFIGRPADPSAPDRRAQAERLRRAQAGRR
jgi:hypothetical protein